MTQFSRKKIIAQKSSTDLTSTNSRITNLENNEYKVTYYEIISGASGSLTLPTGATINAGEFGLSGNCVLSKIDGSNKPTFESPKTAGGTVVTASLNETTGAWVASGVYTDANVALIYSIKIKAVYYSNLTYTNIIETVNDIPTVLPRKYFAYNNTTYSYTGTTASTILRTIYIPANSMNLNSTLELHAIFGKSGTAGTMNYAAYITTNPSVITGGSIVKINSFASNILQGGFVLRLTNKNSLNSQAIQLQNPGANQYDSWQLTNFARTLLSIDFAVDQYLHIYSTLGNATDTAIIYDYQCYIDKN